MAWNQPGNDKNKRRDPWQDGEPPDLEEALKNMKDRLARLFGGGGGGGSAGGPSGKSDNSMFLLGSLLIGGVVILWLLFSTWVTIDESQRGVLLRFGKFHSILEPGFNLKLPSPIDKVDVVEALRVRSVSDEMRMLTKDENFVIVDYNVQFQAPNAKDYLLNVRSPDDTLQQMASSAVRQVVGGNTLDSVLSGERTQMANTAREIMQKALDDYGTGITVTEMNFQNIRPPDQVKVAFDDAIAAREDNQRIKNEAEAYRSKVEPEARGVASRLRTEAEGYKTALVATATGEARRFELLEQEYSQAPQVTRKRLFLETMQDVLSRNPKVMVDVGGGNQVMYLPLDKLIQNAVLPTIVDPKRDTSGAAPERVRQRDVNDPLSPNREPRQ